MAHSVDPAMDPVESPLLDTPFHPTAVKPGLEHLAHAHHAVLPGGNPGNRMVY